MEKEFLVGLKKKISLLSNDESKMRDLYLRGLANGEIQGPLTGYSSIDKQWLKWYDAKNIGVKPENRTIYDTFLSFVEKYGDDHILLSYYGKQWTRKDIELEVEKYKCILKNNFKLNCGDTISLMMLDVPEVLFIWFAANTLGVSCNMIKFDESSEKIRQKVILTNSKYIFVTEFEPMLSNVVQAVGDLEGIDRIISLGMNDSLDKKQLVGFLKEEIEVTIRSEKNMSLNEKISLNKKISTILKILCNQKKSGKKITELYSLCDKLISNKELCDSIDYTPVIHEPLINPEELVSVIVYTGGTTGDSKGVQLTNKNLNTMVYGVIYGDGEFNDKQISMNILPPGIAFYYNGVLSFMCNGINIDLVSHFTETTYPYLVAYHKPNVLVGGPILMEKTRKSNAIEDASYIEISASGGDKLPVEEERDYNKYLAEHGGKGPVHQGWGMSECAAVASYSTTKSYVEGTIGIPLINFEVAVFEYGTDIELECGEIGELCISSDSVMKGYLNNPEATSMVLKKHSDGKLWLHCDDLGYIDSEGRIFHKGRVKRMLTRAGSKVWLSEIENVIDSHECVEKCCCVKISDEMEREVPVAHIVLKEDTTLSIADIIEEISDSIKISLSAPYLPKYFVIKNELPYTAVNKKVDYRALEQENISFDDVDGNIVYTYYRKSLKK